ncbi:mucin-19-like [Plodia interpunctella]|uniref:mucin-19-like n=1 Tax=Plodia interpunctella TaxID=58824 RepID=UPI002367AC1B|nr:mucin-19-like [Plodia interpunctella]
MKPLLSVVALCLLSVTALPESIEDVKQLPQSKEPIVEAEESETQTRTERCSTCTAKLNIKSPNDVLAAIQALPGAVGEVHTQQSFEGCSSDKGCAGLKVKDGKVVERFGNVDAFRAAAAADAGNEFTFHAAGTLGSNAFGAGQAPFWWMNQDSPFKNGGGNFEKFEKSSSSFSSSGSTGAGGDLAANAFLAGGLAGAQGQGVAGKPGATYQSSSFESSSFSSSKDGEVDIANNPFLNGGIKFGQGGFQAQGSFGASGQGSNQFSGAQGAGFSAQGGAIGAGQNKYSGSSQNTAFSAGSSQSAFGAQGGQGFGNQANSGQGAFGTGSQSFGAQGTFSASSQQNGQYQGSGSKFGNSGISAQGNGFGNSAFQASNSASANKFSAGFSGSSPRPFAASTAAGSNVNLIQNSQKTSEFDYEQQQQQNIDDAFQSTGNVNSQGSLHSGGELQQTCAGQGYVCVHKAQCNNGVVNTNGQSILQAKTSKQYCNVKTEICCRIELSNLAGAAGQESLGVGLATYQGNGGLFASSSGQSGQGSSSSGQSGQSAFGSNQSGQSAFGSSQSGQSAFGSNQSGQSGQSGAGFNGQAGTSTSSFEASSFNKNTFTSSGQNGGNFGASGQNGVGSYGATGQVGLGTKSGTNQFGVGTNTNKFGSSSGQFGSSSSFGSISNANSGSVNRETTASGFGSQGGFASTNKYNGNGFASSTPAPNRFGSTGGYNEVFKTTSQSNFIETDSFSAGSENTGVFRPGASGTGLKPGIPYLPPVDSNTQASVLVTSTVRPRPTTVKPTYLPPSTSAPGYLPPDQYNEGSLLLDVTRTSPRPPAPPPQPNDQIPAGCAAALKCTPIEYCTAEGVMSNTTVVLTRDQEAYRVPLTDCKDLETGRIGKCCRDPNYSDPWPTNLIGKWVNGVFGGDDGKYNPTKDRQVTAQPPVNGGLTQTTFGSSPRPGVGKINQNQFGVASQAQTGQFGFGTQQTQGSQISATTTQFNQNKKIGEAAITGQGQGVSFGQGQGVSFGQGQGVSQGQGAIGIRGGGQRINEFSSQNTKEVAFTGQQQGQGFAQGQGQGFIQGQGQGSYQGQGAITTQTGGQRYNEFSSQSNQVNSFQSQSKQNQIGQQSQKNGFQVGVGQGVLTGVGQGVIQGGGSIVTQGSRYDVESQSQYSENIYRVFLQQYQAGGTCGVLNPQNPYGNRNELEVDFAEIPWQAMVLLQTNKSLLCGGVITRPDVVVTSAACVDGLTANVLKVKGGEWKLGIDDEPLPFQIVGVKHILRHPFYKRGSLEYDAAILVLDENLRLANNIYPICLPGARDTVDAFYNGAGECIVTGWGKQVLQAHLAGSIMHSVNVSLINPGECQAKLSQDYPHLLEQYNQDSCVCGQPTNPTNNICRVDVGSALACTTGNGHFVLRGVYSWDSGCQLGNQLAAFYKFDLEWYEWAIGLIESARFAQFANGATNNRFSGQLNSGIKSSGQINSGIKGSSGVKGSFSNKYTSGQVILPSNTAGKGQGQTNEGNGQFTSGFSSGFSQFGSSKYTQGSSAGSSGVTFSSAPISNSFSATYSEKKVFKSEPQIITYTTKPEIVTFTTPPKYFTYTTKPEIITYTTKPQIITYETSGSDTNSQYAVAPNVSFNPSFTDAVKGHTHNAQCKCLENGKK